MPQVTLLTPSGFIIMWLTTAINPNANSKNSAENQAANKTTILFCVKVVASRYSSLISIKGFV